MKYKITVSPYYHGDKKELMNEMAEAIGEVGESEINELHRQAANLNKLFNTDAFSVTQA